MKKTILYEWHRGHGGDMVEFGGWEMPIRYETGIIQEHLTTRKYGGLFDVSHMGRFFIHFFFERGNIRCPSFLLFFSSAL